MPSLLCRRRADQGVTTTPSTRVQAEAALADSVARREQVEQVRRRAHAVGWLLDREAEQNHFAERIRAALGGAP